MNYLITIKFRSPALRDKFHGDPDSAAYREQLNYNWITIELQYYYRIPAEHSEEQMTTEW